MLEKLRLVGCAILDNCNPNEFFTLDQVIEISGLDRTSVRRALEQFNRERLVLKIEKKADYMKVTNRRDEWKGRPPLAITYHIAKKKKFAERMAPKLKEGTAQDRMWAIMRGKGVFSVSDIIVLAEVAREHARWFVKRLRRAGIVKMNGKGGPGVTWSLVKDVGPRRPYVGAEKAEGRKQ